MSILHYNSPLSGSNTTVSYDTLRYSSSLSQLTLAFIYLKGLDNAGDSRLFFTSVCNACNKVCSVTPFSKAARYWAKVSFLLSLSFRVSPNLFHLSDAGKVFQKASKPAVYGIVSLGRGDRQFERKICPALDNCISSVKRFREIISLVIELFVIS